MLPYATSEAGSQKDYCEDVLLIKREGGWVKKRTSLSICKRLTTEGLANEIRRKSELSVGAQSQCENASVASRIGGKFVGRVTADQLFTTASQNASRMGIVKYLISLFLLNGFS